MDEIARLVGAQAALFVCGERPGLGFADSMSAYYIYQPAAGATDADREVISNINPRGRAPADAAGDVAAAIERILREKKSGVVLARSPPMKQVRKRCGSTCRRSSRARWRCAPSPTRSDDLARALGLPAGRRALGHHHRHLGRRAVRRAGSGDQGVARRRRLRQVVLRRRRLPVGAAVGRVHRHLRRRAIPPRSTPRSTPASPTSRTRPGSTPWRRPTIRTRPVAFFPHVIASVGPLPGAAGRHRRRQPARLPDRAAARVDRRPRRRVQGGARARRQVVRAAVGDQLRRRLPVAAICPPARPPRAPSPRRSSTSARAPLARRSARGAGEAWPARRRAPRTAAPPPGRFRALATGERFAEKPDHLTHLVDDASLVPKTHPRIVARGKLDLLQSARARRAGRRRRRRGARAGRRAGRDPRAGARAGRRRGDRPRGPAADAVRHELRRAARRHPPHLRALRRAVHVPRRAPGPGGGQAVAGARHRARGRARDHRRLSADAAARSRRRPRAPIWPTRSTASPRRSTCSPAATWPAFTRAAAGRSARSAAGSPPA